MNDRSTLLLEHHLKELKLPSFLREYGKMAAQCAAEGVDHPQYLLRLSELELIDRHQRMVERRIRAARFPAVKSLDTFDFPAIPSLNKALVMELARCEYIQRRENIIAVGNSGTGKTHMALGLGLSACQRGMSVGFTTAAALVHEMMEARDERRLLNLQRQLSRLNLLIIDELGFVPLSRTGAELLFEVFSQRYEQGSILVTTNLPFDEWTEVFGSERLTGALLNRLTHHVHILEMNGESYRLKRSRENAASQGSRRSRGRIGRTVNPVPSCSLNVSTLTNLLTSVITSVVHDHAAPVAHYLGALDNSGGLQRVWPAPGHGAQDADPLRSAGVPATDSSSKAQPFDMLRRSLSPASSTGSWRMTSRAPGSSGTRPSASSSGSGTSTGSTADTPQSRTTSERIAVRPGRCLSRCPMRRDTRSSTSARPWWSSTAWSARPTASSSTCPTATAASSRPIRPRPRTIAKSRREVYKDREVRYGSVRI